MALGPDETIVGNGRVMSATEAGIAEGDAADVADVEMAEELAAGVTKFSKMEILSKIGWSEV